MKDRDNIDFIITPSQAFQICKYFDKNIDDMESYEISELLDEIIDRLEYSNSI